MLNPDQKAATAFDMVKNQTTPNIEIEIPNQRALFGLTIPNGTGIGSAVNYVLFGDLDSAWA